MYIQHFFVYIVADPVMWNDARYITKNFSNANPRANRPTR